MADGRVPYRDFAVEYPPLALPVFALPRVASTRIAGYTHAFTALMGICAAGIAAAAALAARAAGLPEKAVAAAGGLAAVGPALVGSVALTRYDLWPTLLAALALVALTRSRYGLAGGLLGLAAAAKLWPLLLVPGVLALAAREGGRRRALRVAAWVVAGVAVPFAVAIRMSPSGVASMLHEQLDRPLQLESTGATALLALHRLGLGGPYHVDTADGSQNLIGPHVGLAATLTGLAADALVLTAAVAAVRAVRRAPDDRSALQHALRLGLVALVASVALGRVLSPQYVLWLLPFPFLTGRPRWIAAGLVAAAAVLTQLEFPSRYWAYVHHLGASTTALVAARDVALLALLVVLACDARRPRWTVGT
jgi:hypothetical protein